jgi:UDP-GlcNAc:undecaprenyl-phosphate GlcNAc-1-phosphate transferase
VPLLGGVAIFLSFWLVSGYLYFFTDLIGRNISARQLLMIFLSSVILIIVGIFDDKYQIKPLKRLFLTSIAVFFVLAGGINFDGITNPFGGVFGLDFWKIDTAYFGTVLVAVWLIVFFWLTGMMYTVKILDGLDGLSVGVSAIGALAIAALAGGATKFFQPDISLLAIVLAGACAGFLLLNFYPAKIFLGEGGGLFLGLMVGVLASVSGSKIATTLLVMAVPIIDLCFVFFLRIINRQSILKGDRKHLHFRMIDSGIPHSVSVLILYFIAAMFGFSALYMPSLYKFATLIILSIIVVVIEFAVSFRKKI